VLAIISAMVYYLDMASIVGKRQVGKTYYYLVESARVDGKPRIVSQRYLGSAEEIAARLSEAGPGEPDRSRHLAFGDVAATWSMLCRLGVAEIVDDVVGARRKDAGASVGTYIALAALNRVCDPCSKLALADWWATTAGDRWLRLRTGTLEAGCSAGRLTWRRRTVTSGRSMTTTTARSLPSRRNSRISWVTRRKTR